MQRGIIQLNPSNISIILSLFENQSNSTLLITKLINAQSTSGTTQSIQLSFEEAEMILDNLPPPTMNEDQDLKSTRNALREFINLLSSQS